MRARTDFVWGIEKPGRQWKSFGPSGERAHRDRVEQGRNVTRISDFELAKIEYSEKVVFEIERIRSHRE